MVYFVMLIEVTHSNLESRGKVSSIYGKFIRFKCYNFFELVSGFGTYVERFRDVACEL